MKKIINKSFLYNLFKNTNLKYKYLLAVTKILKTKSIIVRKKSNVVVSCVTSKKDYVFLILAIKSFFSHINTNFSLIIFDDGSLSEKHVKTLKKHLINSIIINKKQYVKKVKKIYGKNHVFFQKKDIPYVMKKLGPVLFTSCKKIIFLDSDVLFFKNDSIIDNWIQNKYDAFFIQDHQDAYFLSQIESRKIFGVNLLPKLNSGFLGINRKDINLTIFKKLLETYEQLSVYRPWQFQTFFAIALSRKKCLVLPRNYLISEKKSINSATVCCHYVRTIRHKMYNDAQIVLNNLNL